MVLTLERLATTTVNESTNKTFNHK